MSLSEKLITIRFLMVGALTSRKVVMWMHLTLTALLNMTLTIVLVNNAPVYNRMTSLWMSE